MGGGAVEEGRSGRGGGWEWVRWRRVGVGGGVVEEGESGRRDTNLCPLTYQEQAILEAVILHPPFAFLAVDGTVKP